MEKKNKMTVSVFGSCMSRNIFNCPQCREVFDVKHFAFQVLPWSCFDTPFNIEEQLLDKLTKSAFQKKILSYNFNKTALTDFSSTISDYFISDFTSSTFILQELHYQGKSMICRMGHGEGSLNLMCQDDLFKDFSYKKVNYKSVPMEFIYEGLDKFINWLDTNYKRNQIIICRIKFPEAFIGKGIVLKKFSESKIQILKQESFYINSITDYVISKMPGCIVYEFPEGMIGEEYGLAESPPYHQTNMDYIRQGDELLKLLKIDYKKDYSLPLEPVAFLMETWAEKYFDCRNMLIQLENELLDTNIKDVFKSTSVSSVSTQPFDKDFVPVDKAIELLNKKIIILEKESFEKGFSKAKEEKITEIEELKIRIKEETYKMAFENGRREAEELKKNSLEYKCGDAILFLPKKVKKFFCYWKRNGFKATMKRVFGRIMSKKRKKT